MHLHLASEVFDQRGCVSSEVSIFQWIRNPRHYACLALIRVYSLLIGGNILSLRTFPTAAAQFAPTAEDFVAVRQSLRGLPM